jgi:hypothetical protein
VLAIGSVVRGWERVVEVKVGTRASVRMVVVVYVGVGIRGGEVVFVVGCVGLFVGLEARTFSGALVVCGFWCNEFWGLLRRRLKARG